MKIFSFFILFLAGLSLCLSALKYSPSAPFPIRWISSGLIETGAGTSFKKVHLYVENAVITYRFNNVLYDLKFKDGCIFFKTSRDPEWCRWLPDDVLTKWLAEQSGVDPDAAVGKINASIDVQNNRLVIQNISAPGIVQGFYSAPLAGIDFNDVIKTCGAGISAIVNSAKVSNPPKTVSGNTPGNAPGNTTSIPSVSSGPKGLPVPPPKRPAGPATGKVGELLTYTTKGTDPLKAHLYLFDWGDGTNTGWKSYRLTQSHTYRNAGTYQIRAKEKCPLGLFETDWSKPFTVVIGNTGGTIISGTGGNSGAVTGKTNIPVSGTSTNTITSSGQKGLPVPPPKKPSGPVTGKIGELLTYTTKGTDPLKAHLYLFDWGDGTNTGWKKYKLTQRHIYRKDGTYLIRAKEKCPLGLFETDWSKPLKVTIGKPMLSGTITTGTNPNTPGKNSAPLPVKTAAAKTLLFKNNEIEVTGVANSTGISYLIVKKGTEVNTLPCRLETPLKAVFSDQSSYRIFLDKSGTINLQKLTPASPSTTVSDISLSQHPKRMSPYGINAHIPDSVTLDRIAEAGIPWIRIDFNWFLIEPDKGKYNWTVYDQVVQQAKERNLQIFATLAYSPAWANGGNPGRYPPVNPSDWADFVYQAVSRYSGRIEHWGLWNEPDLEQFFAGSVHDYMHMILFPGAEAIRKADPNAKVLGPEVAGNGRFLEEILASDQAWDCLDIVTIHKYGDTLEKAFNDIDGWNWPWKSQPYKVIFDQANRTGKKQVWWTETGWPTAEGTHVDTVSEEQQALLYTSFLEELRKRTWINKVFFYEIKDDPTAKVPKWGVIDSSGHPKPAFDSLKNYILKNP